MGEVVFVVLFVVALASTIAKSLLILRKGPRDPDVAESLDLSPAEAEWHHANPKTLRSIAWMMLVVASLSIAFLPVFVWALLSKRP